MYLTALKEGDLITIGPAVVKIVRLKKKSVRIGIKAPAGFSIARLNPENQWIGDDDEETPASPSESDPSSDG